MITNNAKTCRQIGDSRTANGVWRAINNLRGTTRRGRPSPSPGLVGVLYCRGEPPPPNRPEEGMRMANPSSKRDRKLPYTSEAWVDVLDGQGTARQPPAA